MLAHHRRDLSILAAIGVILVVLGFSAHGFFTLGNLRDLVMANMSVLMAALGMTLVILTGQIDISVGSQFAICSVTAGVLAKAGLSTPVAGVGACLLGALFGSLNGALIAWVEIPSIVVTLAVMVGLRDGLRWMTEGAWVQDLPPSFQWFGRSQAASEWLTVAAALLLASALAVGLRHLAAGRAVYAAGSNADAARLAGVDPRKVVFWVFVLMGALTGCAAFFNSVRFNQIPSNAGLGLELEVIAAVIVGGSAITGGRGTVAGTVLGVILLGIIGPALTFLSISAYWERAIQGAIILVAVAAHAVRVRRESYAGGVAAQRA